MNTYAIEEEQLFNKIGGWLVLPAFLHPILGVLINLKDSYDIFSVFSDKLPIANQIFIFIFGVIALLFAVTWIASAYLAGTLNPTFPKFYIWLLILSLATSVATIVAVALLFDAKITSDDYTGVFKNFLAVLVWVPYMLISKRVKATFYGIPMPLRAFHKNVGEPLQQYVAETKVLKSREPVVELSMVQRLGMVLYWFGIIVAVVFAGIGIFAIANNRNDGAIVGWALMVSAAVAWGVGRALRYILVGK